MTKNKTQPKNWEVKTEENELYQPVFAKEWAMKSLYDLADWINGLSFKDSDFENKGLPILKIAEIKNGLSPQTKYTSKKFNKKYFVKREDILFSWSGTPETSIDIFFWGGLEGWLNQHTFRVQPKEVVNKKFFYYLLRYLKKNFIRIASNKKTTGLGHVTTKDLRNLTVRIPQESYQKRIADVLSVFDDKIELNNKINQNLEQTAQAIFKEWFIKFKFPGHEKVKMIDSELRKIPEGWEVGYFGDENLTDMISNGIKEFAGEKIYLATADVNSKEVSNDKIKIFYNDRPSRADMQPILNSIWFAKMINTYKVLFFSDANKEDLNKFILSTGFMGVKCNKDSEFYIYILISSAGFHSLKDTLVQGAVQEALTLGNIKKVKILIPSKEILLKFNEIIKPIFSEIYKNRNENKKLASLRDLLLPKLMSGEIKV